MIDGTVATNSIHDVTAESMMTTMSCGTAAQAAWPRGWEDTSTKLFSTTRPPPSISEQRLKTAQIVLHRSWETTSCLTHYRVRTQISLTRESLWTILSLTVFIHHTCNNDLKPAPHHLPTSSAVHTYRYSNPHRTANLQTLVCAESDSYWVSTQRCCSCYWQVTWENREETLQSSWVAWLNIPLHTLYSQNNT